MNDMDFKQLNAVPMEEYVVLKKKFEDLQAKVETLVDWVTVMGFAFFIGFPTVGILAGLALWKLR